MDTHLAARLKELAAAAEPPAVRAGAIADLIRRTTSARWVGVYRVADGMVINEAWSGPAAPAHPVFPATRGLTAHAVRTGAVALSNDVAGDPRYLTNQADSGSELIVPVVADGEVIGTLDIEYGAVGAFRGADIDRYEQLVPALRALWRSDVH